MSKYILRLVNGVFLIMVFIIQSVILSLFTVYTDVNSELPNHYINPLFQKIFWIVVDFIVLLGFVLASWIGFKHLNNIKRSTPEVELESSVRNGEIEAADEGGNPRVKMNCQIQGGKSSIVNYLTSARVPLSYISWFLYATGLVVKISVIFGSDWLEKFGDNVDENGEKANALGPEMLELGIGLSGIVFSLLVEAHNNARKEDVKRNAYLSHISYGVALEVLDTTSLLAFLIPSSEEIAIVALAPEKGFSLKYMTPVIILLAAINLVLPCITLYKLSASSFGALYHVKLEMIYNTLHFILISIPFLSMRIYLWAIHGHKDILFLIKNIYSIIHYFRDFYSDAELLKEHGKEISSTDGGSGDAVVRNGNRRNIAGKPNGDNSIEMSKLMK